MESRKTLAVLSALLASWAGAGGYSLAAGGTGAAEEQRPSGKQAGGRDTPAGVPVLPRGKKQFLKDGALRLARDYQTNEEWGGSFDGGRGGWGRVPAAVGE